jgi:transposase-like protein
VKENTMTDLRMTMKDWLVQSLENVDEDFLKAGARMLAESLMELEVSELAGAERYERSSSRKEVRNGYRSRGWDTRAGSLELRVPKLRGRGYQPSFLEPRTRAERALFSVVQEAYIHGVSTRKVEDLVKAMGINSMDKSRVSRMCAELDGLVEQWRQRKLTPACPYLMLDAKYIKVRDGGCVVSKALVVAFGVLEDGVRSVIGVDLFAVESTATWRSFLRSLVERGLHGVKLVVSDDHQGLKAAVAEVLTGTAWQRCTVHFMRNMEGHVAKKDRDAVKTIIRSVLNQESKEDAQQRLKEAVLALGKGKVARLFDDAQEDLLAHMNFPQEHWRKMRSTNPIERLNKEIARRVNVVGIFPTEQSVIRLVGSVLMEQDEEWLLGKRYMSLHSMATVLGTAPMGLLEAAA